VAGVIFHRGIPIPEMPEDWSENEAEALFESILACYVWRYLHVQTRANINLAIWKATFSTVVKHCWYMVVALFEAVFDVWVKRDTDISFNRDSFDCQKIYFMAMEKRRYRRKSSAVRRYEDVDEYVDNMYLNE
jgi:hypothetical protein